MVQLTVITLGTLKEKYFLDGVGEYKKRLGAFCRVDEVNLKECVIKNEDAESEVIGALKEEGERILAKIPDGAFVVALCVEGKQFDSVELSKILSREIDKSGKLCFIIGSSHGLGEEVKKRADLRLSVSELTFPHQLMRVMLYEILYRSFSIRAGKKYHK